MPSHRRGGTLVRVAAAATACPSHAKSKSETTRLRRTEGCLLAIVFRLFLALAVLLECYVIFVSHQISFLPGDLSSIPREVPSRLLYQHHQHPTYPDESTRSYVDFCANNGFSNAVSSSHYPSGVYNPTLDRTYSVFQGPHEDPYAIAYDHSSHKWIGPVKVGTSLLGQLPDPMIASSSENDATSIATSLRPANNNGKPVLAVDDLGYIHVSFGGDGGDPALRRMLGFQNGTGEYRAGRQIHARSKFPHNVSEWTLMKDSRLSWRGRQPQFVKVGAVLYHFVVYGARAASITYQMSEDHGQSWSEVRTVLSTGSSNTTVSNTTVDSWDCRFREGTGIRSHSIVGVCSYLRYENGNRTPTAYNGYYLEYDTRVHMWRNIHGETLVVPLSKPKADETSLVFSTEDPMLKTTYRLSPCPASVTSDQQGHPHLLFQLSSSNQASAPKKVAHVGWTGKAWTIPRHVLPREAFPEASEEGDLVAQHEVGTNLHNLEVVVASSNQTHSVVQSWISHDHGVSWHRHGTDWLALRGHGTLHLSALIRHSRPDARILAYLHEPSEVLIGSYRKMHLLGQDGPLRRRQTEADLCRGVQTKSYGSVCTSVKALKSRRIAKTTTDKYPQRPGSSSGTQREPRLAATNVNTKAI